MLKKLVLLFPLILLPSQFAFGAPSDLQALVVGVPDGDTIKVLTNENRELKVRLSGIDAPEKKQAFGHVAKQHLADMVYGKLVSLECGKQDRYQRHVCKVLLNNQDINLYQISTGMAWWYRKYANEQPLVNQQQYEQAENIAKQKRMGLWSEANPTAPWEWRHH